MLKCFVMAINNISAKIFRYLVLNSFFFSFFSAITMAYLKYFPHFQQNETFI